MLPTLHTLSDSISSKTNITATSNRKLHLFTPTTTTMEPTKKPDSVDYESLSELIAHSDPLPSVSAPASPSPEMSLTGSQTGIHVNPHGAIGDGRWLLPSQWSQIASSTLHEITVHRTKRRTLVFQPQPRSRSQSQRIRASTPGRTTTTKSSSSRQISPAYLLTVHKADTENHNEPSQHSPRPSR
jgi:hypothetical protein